jgi:sialate O-acetylesterase
MIKEWRIRFQQEQLPFYLVQLPELKKVNSNPDPSLIAELREAQSLIAHDDDHIEMAVIIDTHENGNIHPKTSFCPVSD